MEKITEIRTKEEDKNAFEILMKCKMFSEQIDLTNIILDATSIDEKEMLIELLESLRNLEIEIIEVEPMFIPEAKA
tara:strand:+ start:608 stop:835 length:228 start_codon:yes stop_codon:yes gene_type:complete